MQPSDLKIQVHSPIDWRPAEIIDKNRLQIRTGDWCGY